MCHKYFQVTNKVWIYDVAEKHWTPGPSLKTYRHDHSCMVDQKTETIHVLGGNNYRGLYLKTTETLKLNEANTSWKMGPELKELLTYSAAVSSKSNVFVGYLIGGSTRADSGGDKRYGGQSDSRSTSKIWALQRTNMQWVELPKTLKFHRRLHTVVNVNDNQIPGC